MTSQTGLLHRLFAPFRRRFHEIFDREVSANLVLLSALVGALAGLVAIAFTKTLTWSSLVVQGWMQYSPPGAGTEASTSPVGLDVVPWAILLFPTLGGLVSGFLVYRFCPEAEGHGSDAMVKSFHRLQGAIRARVPLIKGLASIVTIASGGSAGREGPIAQVGAGVGAILARWLKLGPDSRRYLMLAGAAGGISAVFQSPFGAALFVCEVLYASAAMESAALLFTSVSAVSAYAVFTSLHGEGHEIIAAKALAFHGVNELPFFAAFAPICAVAGYFYVRTFYGLRDHVFRRLKVPLMLKPAIGGLALGVLILAARVPGVLPHGAPHVINGGYGWIQQALDGDLIDWRLLGLLAMLKIIATSLTISSGGSGGVFAPSLFIGAMLGGAYGWLCHSLFPQLVPNPQVFVLVGMGAFFAGVAKVPITAAVMVSEMTGTFSLLVPLLLVCMLNNALLSRKVTLYEEQVASPIDSPAHLGDFLVDVLAHLTVDHVYDKDRHVPLIDQKTPLAEILKVVETTSSDYFPVVNDSKRLVGIFSLSDLRSVLPGFAAGNLIRASDIAVSPVLTITPESDLHTALQLFTMKNVDELPVVASHEPDRVLGMLRRKELIAAYLNELARLRRGDEDHQVDGNGHGDGGSTRPSA